VFPLTIIRDVCSFEELRDCTISLMDIARQRLERTAQGARALVEEFDLLTGAVCTLRQVREMVDRMFEAQAEWLPSFVR